MTIDVTTFKLTTELPFGMIVTDLIKGRCVVIDSQQRLPYDEFVQQYGQDKVLSCTKSSPLCPKCMGTYRLGTVSDVDRVVYAVKCCDCDNVETLVDVEKRCKAANIGNFNKW